MNSEEGARSQRVQARCTFAAAGKLLMTLNFNVFVLFFQLKRAPKKNIIRSVY